MAGERGALLLSAEESQKAQELLLRAVGGTVSTTMTLQQFISEGGESAEKRDMVLVALNDKDAEAAATAAPKLLAALEASGILIAAVGGASASQTLATLGRSYLYVGFTSVPDTDWPRGLLADSEQQFRFGLWKRPSWALGVSAALDGEELVDEDALIDASETYKPMGKGRSDCASRPRACANCTCGRKEQEEATDREAFRKELESGAVRSSCGSCYLGDAFRCAGCPYKGLPAFRPGEKVNLLDDSQIDGSVVAPGATAIAPVVVAERSNKVTLATLDDL